MPLAITLRSNTIVAANAPECALRLDRQKAAVSQPQQVPNPSSAGRQISRTEPPPTAEPSRLRNHPNRAKHEIPIDHHRNPAGSCLGGFPTPDGIRKPSPSRPSVIRRRPPQKRTWAAILPATLTSLGREVIHRLAQRRNRRERQTGILLGTECSPQGAERGSIPASSERLRDLTNRLRLVLLVL
jgi:hypothetical protein